MEMLDKLVARFGDDGIIDATFWLFNGRRIATSILVYIAGSMLDLSGHKALELSILVYFVHWAAIGQRRLEQLSFLFLIAATIWWMDIFPTWDRILQIKADVACKSMIVGAAH
jgi:hypothetical protein